MKTNVNSSSCVQSTAIHFKDVEIVSNNNIITTFRAFTYRQLSRMQMWSKFALREHFFAEHNFFFNVQQQSGMRHDRGAKLRRICESDSYYQQQCPASHVNFSRVWRDLHFWRHNCRQCVLACKILCHCRFVRRRRALRLFYTGQARRGDTRIEIYIERIQQKNYISRSTFSVEIVWIDDDVRGES